MRPNEYSDPEFVKLREKVHELEVDVARLQENKKDADKALDLARTAMERSQAASNEWRQENIDQRALYPTVGKVEGLMQTEAAERRSLEARISALEKSNLQNVGRGSAFNDVWLKFITVATLVSAVVIMIYKVLGK